MSTGRSWRLVCGVTAVVILALAFPGLAAESPPTILWNATPGVGQLPGGVGVGPDGHPVVAGWVCDTVPFPTACDIRVVKHNGTSGEVIWGITFAVAVVDFAGGLAIGADGHPVVTGGSCGPAFTDCDFRTVKLDGATGALIWSVTFDGGGGDLAGGVAVGPDGNPVVIGTTSCLPDFTTGCRARVLKLSGTSGAVLWNVTYDSVEVDGVAVGADGHPVVTVFPSCSGCPSRIVKYDGLTGAVLWDVAFGGSNAFGSGVAIGSDGNPVVAGGECAPDFPTCAFRTAKHERTTGAELWSVVFAAGGSDSSGSGVAVGGDGHPIVVGTSCAAGAASPCDIRTIKYDGATGELLWTVLFDEAGNDDFGFSIVVGPDGDPVVVGQTCTPAGVCDVATVKYVLQHDTPSGAPVAVTINGGTGAADGVSVTFTSVSTAGSTTLTASASGPTPPAGFTLGSPAIFYDLATTAVFTGTVQVCINYTNRSVPAPEADLKLLHFQGGSWVDVTSSNDTVARIICGQTSTLSPFLIAERTPLPVTIDIKPGSYPNTINLGSNGVVPVAIFSTATFDARTVDPTTVTLANAAVKLTGKGQPIASFQDVNGDGRLDLIVQVETSALQLTSADTIAVLRGKTFSGQPVQGSDSVRIVP